ncbi:MAG: putative sugar nucleotidyl transferase, partial [Bacteroidota bacterium]
MNYILADHQSEIFYPHTLTRPISELRLGILTIREKWMKYLKTDRVGYLTENHLVGKFGRELHNDNILIDSRVLPDSSLVKQISALLHNQALVCDGVCVAIRVDGNELQEAGYPLSPGDRLNASTHVIQTTEKITRLNKLTELFTRNGEFLQADFKLLTKGKKSAKVNDTNTVLGKQLFVKDSAKVNCSILNTETGP